MHKNVGLEFLMMDSTVAIRLMWGGVGLCPLLRIFFANYIQKINTD